MVNQNEVQLVKYLENQIVETMGFIKETERSIEILTEGDSEFSIAMDEVIQSKLDDIKSYEFRLKWLQSQLNHIGKIVLQNNAFAQMEKNNKKFKEMVTA